MQFQLYIHSKVNALVRNLTFVMCALVSLPLAATEDLTGWHVYHSDNLNLYSDHEPEVALGLLEDLEVFRATIIQLVKGSHRTNMPPVDVFLFKNNNIWQHLPYANSASAVFVDIVYGPRMVIGPAGDENRLSKLYHEYVHYLVANTAPIKYADWYNEGIATFFSTAVIGKDFVYIGQVPEYEAETLSRRGMVNPDDLFAVNSVFDKSNRFKQKFYATAWLATHYFTLGARNGFPSYYAANAQFLTQLSNGVDVDTAFSQSFPISFKDLKRELREYARSDRKDGLVLERPKITGDIRHSAMTPVEVMSVLSPVLGWREPNGLGATFLQQAADAGVPFAASVAAIHAAQRKDSEKSQAYLQPLLERDDLDANTQYNIGSTYRALSQHAYDMGELALGHEYRLQALHWWQVSVELQPYLPSMTALAMYHARFSDESEANAAIDALLASSQHINAVMGAVRAYMQINNYSSVRELLMKAQSMVGHDREIYAQIQALIDTVSAATKTR
ncbi:DUF1570 domain-containing protein [Alteromonas flava]|uniref:DUF1570 domain-containing protein n=1 Tax=Alteromonas flava TaxID=2048003 RepID=UPI000C28EBE6|nr:DUF1570 domain-containing protein [Alteromonas flava]